MQETKPTEVTDYWHYKHFIQGHTPTQLNPTGNDPECPYCFPKSVESLPIPYEIVRFEDMNKEEDTEPNNLFDLARLRERNVPLTEIGSWLESEINDVNKELGRVNKWKFRQMQTRLIAQREMLLKMAEYFLRKV